MRVTPWLSRLLALNLTLQIAIVVTGGLVRLTGSGLGCPTWPQCEPGSYTPSFHPADGIHPYIEFGNRMIGIIVGIVALTLVILVWRSSIGRPFTYLSGLILAGTIGQGVLGGITVRTGLNPGTVMAHFLISMALISLSTMLVWNTRHRACPPTSRVPKKVQLMIRRLGWAAMATLVIVLVLGTITTGSGPHSGDAVEPARFGFDPQTMSWLHADSVLVFFGLLVALLVSVNLVDGLSPAIKPWVLVLAVALSQGVIGYVQYALDLPILLVSLHMLGAALLTMTTTYAQASLLRILR